MRDFLDGDWMGYALMGVLVLCLIAVIGALGIYAYQSTQHRTVVETVDNAWIVPPYTTLVPSGKTFITIYHPEAYYLHTKEGETLEANQSNYGLFLKTHTYSFVLDGNNQILQATDQVTQ